MPRLVARAGAAHAADRCRFCWRPGTLRPSEERSDRTWHHRAVAAGEGKKFKRNGGRAQASGARSGIQLSFVITTRNYLKYTHLDLSIIYSVESRAAPRVPRGAARESPLARAPPLTPSLPSRPLPHLRGPPPIAGAASVGDSAPNPAASAARSPRLASRGWSPAPTLRTSAGGAPGAGGAAPGDAPYDLLKSAWAWS
eukprot:scaffold18450_cov68-Phaeocystis_antarctica.AAC.9